MRIIMATNTYLPHIGGVAQSVERFTREYRKRGHRTLVIAPTFEHMPELEEEVVRVPAIQGFNGSDFSVRLPIPVTLMTTASDFAADVIHSHHPFLLGDTALRLAALKELPLVFTHHTMYEQYTHYVAGNSPTLQHFVQGLSTGYANLADHVIAPSASVAHIIQERGVQKPISVIPTGVDIQAFRTGDGRSVRQACGIPDEALVVGHLGRLAPEKNLAFLAEAVCAFLQRSPTSHFLLAGYGPSEEVVKRTFERAGLANRLHVMGRVSGERLVNTYHAMDVFVFASKSETQGMVLVEAMAAGVPVIALDAPGVREVVDQHNGRLLAAEDQTAFAAALSWFASLSKAKKSALQQRARGTAERFSTSTCTDRTLTLYRDVRARKRAAVDIEDSTWMRCIRLIEQEWRIWNNRLAAATCSLRHASAQEARSPC